jgi:hypothetical protein
VDGPPPECLIAAILEVDDHRYVSGDIRRLGESAPFARRAGRS